MPAFLGAKVLVRRTRLALLAGTALLLSMRFAQAEGPADADVFFDQGKQLLLAGDWSGACIAFRRSFDAEAAVSTAVKLARCRDHEGRAASALAEYRRALELNERLPQAPERKQQLAALVREALRELEPRVPRLLLRFSPRPEGLSAVLDGAAIAPSALEQALPLDASEHQLSLRAPGYRPFELTLALAAGEQREMRVALEREPAARKAALPHERGPGAARGLSSAPDAWLGQKQVGVVLLGASLATLGAAGYFAIATRSRLDEAKSDCDFDARECGARGYELVGRARDAQTAALALVGVGGALAVLGGTLFITAKPKTGSAAGVNGRVALDTAAVSVRGSW